MVEVYAQVVSRTECRGNTQTVPCLYCPVPLRGRITYCADHSGVETLTPKHALY